LKDKAVFPINQEKKPLIKGWPATKKGKYDITELICYGLPTNKANGICVLDCDIIKASDDINDICGVKWLEENFPDIETFTVKSPSGGLHLYFNYDDDIAVSARVVKNDKNVKIDTRGDGGYIVGPTSEGYNIIKDIPIIDFPAELLKSLKLKSDTDIEKNLSKFERNTDEDIEKYVYVLEELYDLPNVRVKQEGKWLNYYYDNSLSKCIFDEQHDHLGGYILKGTNHYILKCHSGKCKHKSK